MTEEPHSPARSRVARLGPVARVRSAFARLRLTRSVAKGTPLHLPSLAKLVAWTAVENLGARPSGVSTKVPNLQATRRLQFRRLRRQFRLAVQETDYYAGLDIRLLPSRDAWAVPITSKEAARAHPGAFIRRGFRPTLSTTTTGTTGLGTDSMFTLRESQLFASMTALSLLRQGLVHPRSIIQTSTSARALLGNHTFMDGCRQAGGLVYQTGIVDADKALAMLSRCHDVAGRERRASVLYTYPSYLGKLVERGLAANLGPGDFELKQVVIGGEVSTLGLRARSRALFGPLVFSEGYGISETWPFGGSYCEAAHLHFDPLRGLMEVLEPRTHRPVGPGEVGSLVLTPFSPFRESTVMLRYDTGDLVRALDEPCACSMMHLPATGAILGKRKFCVETDRGWVGPRDLLEVFEADPAIPLPVRFGMKARDGGVAVELCVRAVTPQLRRDLTEALHQVGISPVQLRLVQDPQLLERALPWRGDLLEQSY